MQNKIITILILAIALIVLSVSVLSISSPEPGKSIVYYLQTLNANILKTQTSSPDTTQPTSTGFGTSIVAKQQTLTAGCIENILTKYASPVKNTGLGTLIIAQATKYEIDAGYALATFRVESSFGKNGEAVANKSIGNRKDEQGNYIKYNSWEEGTISWFEYIERKYISQGKTTIEQIAPIYAPDTENDTKKYIADITAFMSQHKGLC